ncbi:MAG: type II toxin-antitoxin system VapB family antitoxin [Caulobacteraceae bacterium]
MSIEITNPETERVVRELARRLNVEPDEAVRRASEAALEGGLEDEEIAVERIVAEVKKLPVSDARPIDELLNEEEPR